jgi:hypothetical protein
VLQLQFTGLTNVPDFDRLPQLVAREGRKLAEDLGEEYTRSVKRMIVAERAIARGSTLSSVKDELVIYSPSRSYFRRQVTASRAFVFIQKGRKAGKKMPVKLIGTTASGGKIFQPLPEMLEWFTFFGIPEPLWMPIMRAIKKRGIKPRDVLGRAMTRAKPRLETLVQAAAVRLVKGLFRAA